MKLLNSKEKPLFCRVCTVMLAVTAATSASAQPVSNMDYYVMLHPTGNGKVVITSPGQGANAAGRGNGYVGYGHNQAGWTTFLVTGQPPFSTCSGYGPYGQAKWVITGLQVTETGTSSDQGDKRLFGTNFGTSVSEAVWLSFPLVDRDTGVLLKADKDTAQGLVQIYNYNAHDSADGEKLIYYRVELSPCDGGKPVYADPAWGNGGRR